MKLGRILIFGIACAIFTSWSFTIAKGEIKTIKIGATMPGGDVKMSSTNDEKLSLSEQYGENGLLVVFSCNTCPFVVGGKDTEGWEGRYNGVFDLAEQNKINMVLVNSNAARRDKGESLKEMKKRASDHGLKATYLLDKGSVVADAFGARTTPHVFLFNKESKLVYAGAIDDNVNNASAVKEQWTSNALKNLGNGEKIDPAQTRQKGCSIKRLVK